MMCLGKFSLFLPCLGFIGFGRVGLEFSSDSESFPSVSEWRGAGLVAGAGLDGAGGRGGGGGAGCRGAASPALCAVVLGTELLGWRGRPGQGTGQGEARGSLGGASQTAWRRDVQSGLGLRDLLPHWTDMTLAAPRAAVLLLRKRACPLLGRMKWALTANRAGPRAPVADCAVPPGHPSLSHAEPGLTPWAALPAAPGFGKQLCPVRREAGGPGSRGTRPATGQRHLGSENRCWTAPLEPNLV